MLVIWSDKTDYNTKFIGIENGISTDHDLHHDITKLTRENFTARSAQANLASDIASVVKKMNLNELSKMPKQCQQKD